MIICCRGGHNPLAKGSSGYVDEVTEDRKIYAAMIAYLKQAGHTVYNVTPPDMAGVNAELMYGINKANEYSNVDLFVSVHLNAYSDPSANGSEVCIYPNDSVTTTIGNRICKNFESLGFRNRGVKPRTDLGELNLTKMHSMIVECFFCTNQADVALYHKLGADRLGKAIAEAIHGKVIGNVVNEPQGIDPKFIGSRQGQTGIVTVKETFVYEKQSTSSKKLGKVYLNEKLKLYRQDGPWMVISYPNSGGFVLTKDLKI